VLPKIDGELVYPHSDQAVGKEMSLIVFEDDHLLVVNKPAGWNTHAPAPFLGEGIYEWLKHRDPRWSNLAIIHRLDKETSGLLVFGKTSEANRSLTRQFTERTVKKKYLLVTDHGLPRAHLTTVSTIVRAGEKYVSRPVAAAAGRAETRFRQVSGGVAGALVEAEPVTGRTHQIRVHAADKGFPILGDTLYGGTTASRIYLHASEIALRHPVSGEELMFEMSPDWGPDIAPGDLTAPRGDQLPARFALRDAVIDPQLTDSFRVIHGASDAWSGVYVDKLGEFLLVQSECELEAKAVARLEWVARELKSSGAYHKRLNRQLRGTSVSDFGSAAPERFTIRENGLRFEVCFNEGYSVGLFLDQRENRRRLLVNYVAAEFPLFARDARPPEVLNAFSYTCGFSLAAAKAGARATSLDLSKKYLEWGRRNFALNGIDPAQHDFIYGDAFDWMRRLAKKARAFDCIVLDPPTFSQSKDGGAWQAEKHFGRLVEAALPLLKPSGVLLACTNAAKLAPDAFLEEIAQAVRNRARKILQQHYVPQPPDFPITREEPAYLKTAWLRIG
jgi:23S rRNA (cytosine1962-C5)-methyltransferase